MKNYLKLLTLIIVVAGANVHGLDRLRALRGSVQNVIIQNDANSYDFNITANNESTENMHFVGRSQDDRTIAIPMKITKNGKQDEAVLRIVLLDSDKLIERTKTLTLVAPAGKLKELKQINIDYSKGYFGKKKGYKIKFNPNGLGIIVK